MAAGRRGRCASSLFGDGAQTLQQLQQIQRRKASGNGGRGVSAANRTALLKQQTKDAEALLAELATSSKKRKEKVLCKRQRVKSLCGVPFDRFR